MPNNILKAHRTAIETRVAEICRHIDANTELFYNTRQLELMFSSPEELEIYDEFREWANVAQLATYNPTINLMVGINHPCCPYTVTQDIRLNIWHVYGSPVTVWPKTMPRFRLDVDPDRMADFVTRVQFRVHQKVGLSLLREVSAFLLDNCKTYEQARYLFPPLLPILRGLDKGFRNIARDIEHVKRAPAPVEVDTDMRKKLRHVNEFWAQHELMDTFHKVAAVVKLDTRRVEPAEQVLDFGEMNDFRMSIL